MSQEVGFEGSNLAYMKKLCIPDFHNVDPDEIGSVTYD